MEKFKSVLLAFGYGVIAGSALADVAAPGVLTWYEQPGGGQALCNCADIVGSTASSIIHAHWIGGGLGGLAFAVGALVMGGKKKPDQRPPETSSNAPVT